MSIETVMRNEAFMLGCYLCQKPLNVSSSSAPGKGVQENLISGQGLWEEVGTVTKKRVAVRLKDLK